MTAVAALAAAQDGVWPLVAAAGIGLMLGVERERRKVERGHKGTAGIRTFTLASLLGALSARTGEPAVVVAGLAFVGAAALMGYRRVGDPGLTTEVALVVAFMLGVLAEDDVGLAAGLGVAITILLAERSRLHHLVRDALTEQELHDGLLLAASALIVLPLLPDRGIGPGGALNPVTIWRLVVALMAIQALGYVALRVLGPRRGLPLAGFAGGFISSTATIGAMGLRSRTQPAAADATVAAAVASTVATKVLTAVVLGLADPDVLVAAAPAIALGGLVAAAFAFVAARRALGRSAPQPGELVLGRAFELKAPLLLALTISAVVTIAHAAERTLGGSAALVAVGLAGFADARLAAISSASLATAGALDVPTATLGVVIALSTSTVSKAVVALTFARRSDVARVWGALLAILAAAWAGFGAYLALG